jgi:Mlc titration factor MtfA (ptsG expression regulator)
MIFGWFAQRRRKRLLAQPFPEAWTPVLSRNMVHFSWLDADERRRLCELVQLFVAEKDWEGCNGLELTDEIRVTIAGQACLLVLNLQHVLYANVETILVYPSTFIPRRVEEPVFATPGIVHPVLPLLGEAHRRGPVILTWDAVRRSGRHPEIGHNVVYHEFAHKLDMLDGAVDGVPPLGDKEEYERWNRVCKAEYERLRALSDAGGEGVLDPYGSTDEAEFFAVVTEAFFDTPIELAEEYPALYEVLSAFYRQDTAARVRRAAGAFH